MSKVAIYTFCFVARHNAVGKKHSSNAQISDIISEFFLHYYSAGIMEQRYF